MIDLQGAFLAPPEYDLVCLLRDSYVELEAEEVQEQLDRIRPELPDAPEPEGFAARQLEGWTKRWHAAKDADLVLGTRYRGGIRVINWPLTRLILSMGAAKYVKWITGMPFTDPTGGFKCFRRHALESIDIPAVRSNGYSFQIELTHKIWRQGMRIAEVEIIFSDRQEGTSKMSGHIVWEAIWMVWRLLFQNGLRRWPRKKK